MQEKILNFNLTLSPRELIGTALEWHALGNEIALVTLINIEGNAPYPVGSQMLVNDNGHYIGQITGGCAEQAIADQAVSAINAKQNMQQRYGLDSPFFDIKLPCGSGIDVHFETELSHTELVQLNSALMARKSVDRAFSTLVKRFLPNPRLMLFGQGPILVKLAELALQTGFDVCCVAQNDDTARLLEKAHLAFERLELASTTFEGHLDTFTAFISLFHEHEIEVNLLDKALCSDSFYIGALGSRKTHQVRLQGLSELGLKRSTLDRIHGPVGLNIGANTPAQIALSILADVTAHMNQSIER